MTHEEYDDKGFKVLKQAATAMVEAAKKVVEDNRDALPDKNDAKATIMTAFIMAIDKYAEMLQDLDGIPYHLTMQKMSQVLLIRSEQRLEDE